MNKYSTLSDEELESVAETALEAFDKKYVYGYQMSFSVSDRSWECFFCTLSQECLEKEMEEIIIEIKSRESCSKPSKWPKMPPYLVGSVIVVSFVAVFSFVMSIFAR